MTDARPQVPVTRGWLQEVEPHLAKSPGWGSGDLGVGHTGLARERALALPGVGTGPSDLAPGAPGLHLGAGHSPSFSGKFTPRLWSSPPFEPRDSELPTGWVELLTGWSPLSLYPCRPSPGFTLLDPALHTSLLPPCYSAQLTPVLVAQTAKSLPAIQETRVRSLGQEDPPRREWQLAWRILWTEEPGGLQSMGSQESDTPEPHSPSRLYLCPPTFHSPHHSKPPSSPTVPPPYIPCELSIPHALHQTGFST